MKPGTHSDYVDTIRNIALCWEKLLLVNGLTGCVKDFQWGIHILHLD
jgi:hypothetical protein